MHKSDPAKIMGGGREKGELLLLPRNASCECGPHGYSWLWAVPSALLWV